MPTYAGYAGGVFPAHNYYWGSVIAGTLVAMTFSILSFSLMFGCGVGTQGTNNIDLSIGADVWTIVTACIAYFLGGMVASAISHAPGHGWLRGIGVWGLSMPLSILLVSVFGAFLSLAYGVGSTNAVVSPNNRPDVVAGNFVFLRMFAGHPWPLFIGLILGLIFALAGGVAGIMRSVDIPIERTERRVVT